jgi:replicative DNA helicase
LILDIDHIVIKRDDFSHNTAKFIYEAIKKIVEEDKNLDQPTPIEPIILEEKFASLFPNYYKTVQDNISTAIKEICSLGGLAERDFNAAITFIVKNSIRRKSNKLADKIKKDIEQIESPPLILSYIESEVFKFTTNVFKSSDIIVLGDNYGEFLAQREKEANEGTLKVGIDTGFREYNRAIGGGYRPGTINLLGARSKMGKSWFGLKVADYIAQHNIPVLYLDTELEDNYQADRRMAQTTRIPINQLETMRFRSKPEWVQKVKQAQEDSKKFPIHYVDIKGWSVDRQISIVRRFFAKYVGRKNNGKYKDALIILDYLKLMRPNDKGSDKEWEALGYRMSLLHDLMGEYNSPMLALVQLNRDGLEKEDESVVSGSDRLIWLCDNFSILSPLGEAEIALNDEDKPLMPEQGEILIPNTKLKVVVCRQGPGTPRQSYISMYCDIRDPRLGHDEVCGYIEEGPRRRS